MATGADLVTAMALGADGIVLGTALMATEESFAHPYHKQRLLAAKAEDTVLTTSFHINWPPAAAVRVLKNAVTDGTCGDPHTSERTVIGDEEGRPIYLFSTDSPLRSMTGDFASMALYAGTGVGHLTEIGTAADRLAKIVAEAEALLAVGPDIVAEEMETSSPVCYAGEMSGAYMGEEDLGQDIRLLAGRMQATLRAALAQGADPDAANQPPFASGVATLAAWALRLRQLAAAEGGGAPLLPPPVPNQMPAQVLLLQALKALIPLASKPALREPLVQLRLFLEGQGPAASL
jgi:nitronate monooxygenase